MSKHFTVLCIDDKGNPVRESLVSKRSIHILVTLAIICIAVAGAGTYQYLQMRQTLADRADLLARIDQQAGVITGQRNQIQSFAKDINALKSTILSLSEFENKIRIMANLEHKPDSGYFLAVGGSMPEDLDAELPLDQDHDRLVRDMHDQLDQVEQVTTLQHDSLSSLLKSLGDKRNLLAATPSLRPVRGWISSTFGKRVSPFTGRKEVHKGLDIAAPEGTPIIAPADGVILFAGKKWRIGNMIKLDHGYGTITRYGHIEKFMKKKGDRVKRGEVLALVGNTGRSTGPHLHYEVRLNGVPVDPMQYILD